MGMKRIFVGGATTSALVTALNSQPPTNYDYMRDFQRRNDSLQQEEYKKARDSMTANWNYWWSCIDPTKTGTGTTQSPWATFVDPVTGYKVYAPSGAVRIKPMWDSYHGVVKFVPETLKALRGAVPDTSNK